MDKLLVCPLRHAALLVNLDGTTKTVPLDEDVIIFHICRLFAKDKILIILIRNYRMT